MLMFLFLGVVYILMQSKKIFVNSCFNYDYDYRLLSQSLSDHDPVTVYHVS